MMYGVQATEMGMNFSAISLITRPPSELLQDWMRRIGGSVQADSRPSVGSVAHSTYRMLAYPPRPFVWQCGVFYAFLNREKTKSNIKLVF